MPGPADLDLPGLGAFASALPDATTLDTATMVPVFAQNVTLDTWSSATFKNSTALAGHLVHTVASRVGWIDDGLTGLGSMVDLAARAIQGQELAPLDVVKTFGEAAMMTFDVAGLAVPAALKTLETAMIGTISAVPVLGWVVRVGMLVFQVIQAARDKAPEMAQAPALKFSVGDDQKFATPMITRLREDDWTSIFSPLDEPFEAVSLAYSPSGEKDGYAWGPGLRANLEPTDVMGVVPGVRGRSSFYWQSPKKTLGSTHTAGPIDITGWERLTPSSMQLANMAWRMMGRDPLTCCNVDLDVVPDRWSRWMHDRAEPFWREIGSNWLRGQVAYSLGKGGYAGRFPYVLENTGLGNVSLELLARNACDAQRARIVSMFNRTQAAAYVSRKAPALRNRQVFGVWERNRERMLKDRSQRGSLDLRLIRTIDRDYAIALGDAGPATGRRDAYLESKRGGGLAAAVGGAGLLWLLFG